MGRQLRRVPLDFDWPLNEPWKGYLAPKWRRCPDTGCVKGQTAAGAWLEAIVRVLLIIGPDGRRGDSPVASLDTVRAGPTAVARRL